MLNPTNRLLSSLIFTILVSISPSVLAQKNYSVKERGTEEVRIRKEIEENLDWRNRTPETLDEVSDKDRMLYGRLNESILLRQATGERFGIFESFNEIDSTKAFEIRLHKKSKLTGRFLLYGDACESVGIAVEKATQNFNVYTASCSSKKYGTDHTSFLFDYASNNFYQLAVLDYDPIENKPPTIKLENGIYKMRWSVRLGGAKKNVLVVRNFRILKDAKGDWIVKELPPIDDEAAGISPLKKLPIKLEYDLPAFVADWGKR